MQPTLRRRHQMPFGAQIGAAGQVRFRLWAPAAQSVELLLGEARAALPMQAQPGGWFELQTGAAQAGTLYRYRINGTQQVADPAARFNPQGVHGPSEVIDADAYAWPDADWRAPPWPSAVIYELHVGTFNAPGTYAAVAARLGHLARLGVTAIELMPLAAFPGERGWGYDGVLQYAPHCSYGRPEDLKALVAAAHQHGLAVLLDVVYNHFGPEGNYLHGYAPQFFTERHSTPWGAAINFDGADSRTVRDFFIHNALYWLEEYHFDGLRLDAIHAVHDGSEPHVVRELRGCGARCGRAGTPHLSDARELRQCRALLGPAGAADTCDAQWNDDVHHCLHVLLTGENQSYYGDYGATPQALLGRALAEGFAYQGEHSSFVGDAARGAQRPPAAERLHQFPAEPRPDRQPRAGRAPHASWCARAPRCARPAACCCSRPRRRCCSWARSGRAREPFPWFCDFEPQLQRPGARRTRARVSGQRPTRAIRRPSPRARLTGRRAAARARRACCCTTGGCSRSGVATSRRSAAAALRRPAAAAPRACIAVDWHAPQQVLHLIANLSAQPAPLSRAAPPGGVLFATHPGVRASLARGNCRRGACCGSWSIA